MSPNEIMLACQFSLKPIPSASDKSVWQFLPSINQERSASSHGGMRSEFQFDLVSSLFN